MKAKLVWGCLAVFMVALLLMIGATFARAQQAPITTPQLNTDVFVGSVSGFYPTIQNAVTLRCAAAGLGSRVIIPAGSPANGTSGFTIAAVTGGCVKVPIIDLRATPPGFYLWITSAYVLQGTPPAGTAGGALNGTYPNPSLANVNAAPGSCGNASNVSIPVINAQGQTTACSTALINPTQINNGTMPVSAPVVATNASGQIVNATRQGNGTAVQMAAGATHVANDLLIYDANGNAIDSTVLISNLPQLNAANTWSGSTSLTINPTATGTTANSISGANGATKQWFISNTDGSASFGAVAGGQTVIVPGSVTGENAGVTEWQANNLTGAFFSQTFQAKSKIVNGVGLQVATGSLAACGAMTAFSSTSTCAVTMNIPVTEPDTAYSVMGCAAQNNNAALIPANTATFTTTSFVVGFFIGISATINSGTVSCLVIHN